MTNPTLQYLGSWISTPSLSLLRVEQLLSNTSSEGVGTRLNNCLREGQTKARNMSFLLSSKSYLLLQNTPPDFLPYMNLNFRFWRYDVLALHNIFPQKSHFLTYGSVRYPLLSQTCNIRGFGTSELVVLVAFPLDSLGIQILTWTPYTVKGITSLKLASRREISPKECSALMICAISTWDLNANIFHLLTLSLKGFLLYTLI